MELRVLRNFLSIVREGTISASARSLYLTQPTLSRQMRDLEEELGKTLFVRGKSSIILTEEGEFLKERAQMILDLAEKTLRELRAADSEITGEVAIGGGETQAMRFVARACRRLSLAHPATRFRLFSGNAEDVADRIESGQLDFGLVLEPCDLSRYDFLRLPGRERWGLLMPKSSPLAEKEVISAQDLMGQPLLISEQALVENDIAGWMGGSLSDLQLIGRYRLLYNAALMVEEGVGLALCIDGIANTSEESPLCFRPLTPPLTVGLNLIWKREMRFTDAALAFLKELRQECHPIVENLK